MKMQYFTFVTSLIVSTMADSYFYPVSSQQLNTPLYLVKTGSPLQQQQQEHQSLQQYFTQGTLGQYSYGYAEPLSTKQEVRHLDGVTQGSYSYVDANNLLQTVDYTADSNGFHVTATNLPKHLQETPKPVQETPEVAAAREQHLAAYKAILNGDYSSYSSLLPKPVKDTAEVAAAKKEFFALYSAEEEKHKLLQKSALLKSQGLLASYVNRPVSSGFKSTITSKPAVAVQSHFPSLKAPIVPGAGVTTYGYHLGQAFKPERYYLPVA